MQTKSLGFTLFLATLAAFPPISTDMALPAQTAIGEGLQAPVSAVALTLGLFMLGYALAPLLGGPFADSFGRRKTLILGSVLYTLASLACMLATQVEWLLLARVLQGAGAGACSILSLTIIRDLFDERTAPAKISQMNAIMGMAPIIGPSLGSLLLTTIGWRSIYGFMTLCGVLVFCISFFAFKESFPLEKRRAFRVGEIARGYAAIWQNRSCRRYLLVMAFSFGSLFAYISASSHVLMHIMSVSAGTFGLLFAASAIGIGLGAGISGALSKQGWAPAQTIKLALALLLIINAALFALTAFDQATVWNLMALVIISCLAFGIIAPTAAHGVLQPMPDRAGAASAMLGFLQMSLGFAASAGVAFLLEKMGSDAMTLVMLLCATYAFVSFHALRDASEGNRKLENSGLNSSPESGGGLLAGSV